MRIIARTVDINFLPDRNCLLVFAGEGSVGRVEVEIPLSRLDMIRDCLGNLEHLKGVDGPDEVVRKNFAQIEAGIKEGVTWTDFQKLYGVKRQALRSAFFLFKAKGYVKE